MHLYLRKSHVKGTTYTNSRGTVVNRREYDDSRSRKGKGSAADTHGLPLALANKVERGKPGEGGEIRLSKQEVGILLKKGVYGLISAGKNPNLEPEMSQADQYRRDLKLKADLVKMGLKFVRVKGNYDGEEDSFMVLTPNITRGELEHLGQKYNQDSVIYSEHGQHQMVFTTGEHKGEHLKGGGFEYKPEADNYYTELQTPRGKVKFSLNFNWEEYYKAMRELFAKAARQLQGRTEVAGMKVSIENRRASVRQWKNPDDGSEGMTYMRTPYGYFTNGTLGADGDALDVYVGPHREEATHVYVIHQLKAPDFTEYDEDKCMAGFLTEEAAVEAYLRQYNDPRFLGPITAIPVAEFRERALASRGKMLKSGEEICKKVGDELGVDWKEVDLDEFCDGMFEEEEHKDITHGDPKKTAKIVLAHLKEDPKYYSKLAAAMKKSSPHQKTICVDFDGVIADYSKGFQGQDVFGEPLSGASEGMQALRRKGWKIIIFTTRQASPALMSYLNQYSIPFDEINSNSEQPEGTNPGKPIADVYLDDRAVRFESWDQVDREVGCLIKSLVHGHLRHEQSGKTTYVPDYSNKRTVHTPTKDVGNIPPGIPGTYPAPIRLTPGKQIADHKGWGLEHIRQQHGEEIRAAGYKDEMEFVDEVIHNYNAIYRIDSKKIAIVRDSGAGQKIHVVELREERGQKFYSIVTAYIADRAKFTNRTHTLLYKKMAKAAAELWELMKARGHVAYTRHSKTGKIEHVGEKVGQRRFITEGELRDAARRAVALERGIKVPPAWTDVWVNPDPKAPLQVKGRDAKGVLQRLYSKAHAEQAAVEKFQRVKAFAKAYPKIAKQVMADFDKKPEARVLYLIAKTGFRLGGDEERGEKAAYGASTLKAEHITVKGNTISFNFTGKKGVEQSHKLTDKRLADYLRDKKRGALFKVTQDEVRAYLKGTGHGDFLVKDFRTYIANDVALEVIEKIPEPQDAKSLKKAVKAVCEAVAAKLGNTWTMARDAYISPEVFSKWNQVTA